MSNSLQKLEELKTELRRELPSQSPHVLPPPSNGNQSQTNVSPIHSADLKYLNSHWGDFDHLQPFASHRPILGRWIASLKNRFRNYLLGVILGDYLESEREFNASLVRYLNELTLYLDDRCAEVFKHCNEKIDIESRHESARQDVLISEILNVLEKRTKQLESRILELQK